MSRVWRDLAIEWFDAIVSEIGRHFLRSYLDKLHRVLNIGTQEEILEFRYSNLRRVWKIREMLAMPEEDRVMQGDLEFHLRCETAFVALCDLALEDFRYKRFVVHFYKMIDDEGPCDSAIVTATEHLDETHIANVAQIMTNERGMQTFTYEEAP